MSRVILVTGGARSGKSRHALALALARPGPRAFVATAEPMDDEMRSRIECHRRERGSDFATVEVPRDLAGALGRLPAGTSVALVDCLTVWLGNLMARPGAAACGAGAELPEVAAFLDALGRPPCDLVVVTNEVGLGIVPDNALAREFRDRAGRLNQAVAARADEVVLVVSGIPMVIKGERRTP